MNDESINYVVCSGNDNKVCMFKLDFTNVFKYVSKNISCFPSCFFLKTYELFVFLTVHPSCIALYKNIIIWNCEDSIFTLFSTARFIT